jgi:pyruvate-formate lyase
MNTDELHPAVRQARDFTEAYKCHRDEHPAIREALCLKAQYPVSVGPIGPDDMYAGAKAEDRITYLGLLWWALMPHRKGPGKQGGYAFDFNAVKRYADSPADKAVLEELTEFWQEECTHTKLSRQYDEDINTYCGGGKIVGGGGCGMCIALDLDRLVQRGIPGLYADIDAKVAAGDANADPEFLRAARMALDIVVDVCRHYESQARAMARKTRKKKEKARLNTIADTLDAIVDHAPATLREAIQLVWLYSVLTSARHIEMWRPDVAFGDLYVKDIDEGRLTEEEALELIIGLWRMYDGQGDPAVCRLLVGGKGRRNEQNADRFCLAAMEAARRQRQVIPQLTLRFHDGQDPALMSKAFDVLGDGCVFPMLYNDDAILPGVAEALNVSMDEALNYHPLGCGEYMLACCSPSLLNYVLSVPKAVDAALRNGCSSDGERIGPATGDARTFTSFDQLYQAFLEQIEFAATLPARGHALNCRVMRSECALLFASILTDDCIERGRAMFDGGVRYTGACVMGHGYTNAADSLIAIKHLVFERKEVTIGELLAALDDDFEGHAGLYKKLRACPKFGNDHDEVDSLYGQTWRHINDAMSRAGDEVGLGFFVISSVNPGGYFMGKQCGATADGRKCGMPFAIGHAPTAGNDTHGMTAFLNSMAKVDPVNGGAATNVKINREYFTRSRPKLEAMFETFFQQGGLQASVTVVNQDDLRAAMQAPQEYPHLLVRVGGWTSRFIDLEKDVQEDILRRTAY